MTGPRQISITPELNYSQEYEILWRMSPTDHTISQGISLRTVFRDQAPFLPIMPLLVSPSLRNPVPCINGVQPKEYCWITTIPRMAPPP